MEPAILTPLEPKSRAKGSNVNHRKRGKARQLHGKRRSLPGTSPGVVIPDPTQPPSQVEIIAYGPERLVEEKITDLELIPARMRDHPVVWINVEGLGDAPTIERLGEMFDLHRLALEDVVNLHQRPKVEEYGDVLFIVLRMAHVKDRCATEQISIFVGSNFVITFQEGQPGDSFGRVRQRLREKSGRLRISGSDYLAYAMIDAVIDAYYPVLEVYAERIDTLEDIVLEGPKRQVFDRLHEVKSDLLLLRRAIWPQREAIAVLSRETSLRFNEATRPYLRELRSHRADRRAGGNLPRVDGRSPRPVHVHDQQPHQRDNAGADDHVVVVYPAHVYRRHLRNELRHADFPLEHAGAGSVLWLPPDAARHGAHRGRHDCLFLSPRLDLPAK